MSNHAGLGRYLAFISIPIGSRREARSITSRALTLAVGEYMKQAQLAVITKPIDSLIPHPKNPNTHDDKQIKKLAHLIKTHGFSKGSVVIQKATGTILAGHGIVSALKTLGYTDVDVVEADLSDDKAMAFMIADNHIATQSVIDDIGLQQIINELSGLNVPALDFAFDDDDLSALADRILTFNPVGADTQPRLDEKKKVTCPECGHEFTPS